MGWIADGNRGRRVGVVECLLVSSAFFFFFALVSHTERSLIRNVVGLI